MSQNIVPALSTPVTGAVNKLVISALIPKSPWISRFSMTTKLVTTPHRGFTFVQLLYSLLTGSPRLFPIRSIPTPWKGSTVGWIGNTSSKAYPRGHPSFQWLSKLCLWDLCLCLIPLVRRQLVSYNLNNMNMMSLISSKVMMNQFQRTFFLLIRKIHIFESALIHRRTHPSA